MVHIRKYMASDVAMMTELMGELGYPTSTEEMKRRMIAVESNPDYHTFVGTINDHVVGMIGVRSILNYETDERVTQITCLVVSEGYRGQGIGQSLMNYIEEWATRYGSHILYLTSGIKEERKQAHELYKKMGFDVTGYRFIKKINQ